VQATGREDPRRLVVAVEGIDRAGKTTQTELLRRALEAGGETVTVVSFPRYESFFGRTIRALLDGTGPTSAATVDPRSMSLWYALDRWQALRELDPAATVVLLNRYTLSNAVYQSSRVAPEEADELFAWVLELEHRQLGLPEPDLTVVLDVAPELSRERSHRPNGADDRPEPPDVYERSVNLLARARARYRDAPELLANAVVIEADDADGELLAPAAVHEQVLAAVTAHR